MAGDMGAAAAAAAASSAPAAQCGLGLAGAGSAEEGGRSTPPRAAAVQPALVATASELSRMLSVIEDEIIPKTRAGVAEGNKVFGAAVLGPQMQTVVADTNHEMQSPLYHGEVYVIQRWAEQTPTCDRTTSAATANFLSTHEPCCMCISSLVWAGFKRVFYFFPYESTTAQGIPYGAYDQSANYSREPALLASLNHLPKYTYIDLACRL
eukprot:COSAG01_NODE_1942_length_8842_cov_5.900492_8_plen_209_part_00